MAAKQAATASMAHHSNHYQGTFVLHFLQGAFNHLFDILFARPFHSECVTANSPQTLQKEW